MRVSLATKSAAAFAFALTLLAPLAWHANALAQDDDASVPRVGVGASGLRGLVHTAVPVAPVEFNLSASGGYGYTESIGPVDGAHHRASGVLGVGVSPLPWLAFGLRLDGRFDIHPDEGEGAYGGAVGDPRLTARAGYALSEDVSIGGDVTAWFPGNAAPSYEPSATTVDLRALFAYVPRYSRLRLLAAAGFRLDQSSASAPDLERLRFGDRIALGLSDAHAVLGALGLAYRMTALEVFAEVSGDLLVGGGAPELLASPLRATLGARYELSRAFSLELTTTGGLSKRPDIAPSAPLTPIEPRASVLVGLRFNLELIEPKETMVLPDEPAQATAPEPAPKFAPEPAAPTHGVVAGVLSDEQGAPLPEVVVTLRDATGAEREAITDAEGRYELAEVPVGEATLKASAIGFEPLAWTVDVTGDREVAEASAPRVLVAKTNIGVLRGLIRSFASEPLAGAELTAVDAKARTTVRAVADQKGELEVELTPGRYRVTIRAPGYKPHTRQVKVAANNVAILNVDLREE